MPDKSQTVAEAEAALLEIEKFKHAVSDASVALRTAEASGDAEKIKSALGFLATAVKAEQESGISDRDIAKAAQAVLDARGEAHTEVNILPPDFGIEVVDARHAMADYNTRGKSSREQAEAKAHHDKAVAAYELAKAEHVAGAGDRTKAAEAAATAGEH